MDIADNTGAGTLVLGSAGFVGSALCERLAHSGRSVVAMGRSVQDAVSDGITHMRGSIEDRELLRDAVRQSNTIIYAASLTTPGSSARDPALEVFGNLLPLSRLLECAEEFPQRKLIYLSSGGAIYGETGEHADESSLLKPRSYYGAGKAAAEALLHACAATTTWTTVSLRPTNLYGPRQLVTKGFAIVPTLFDRALDGGTFPIWGDGSAVRDYCYIDDLIDAIVACLQIPPSNELAIFNVATEYTASVLQMVELCESVCGRRIHVEALPSRGIDVARVTPSNRKIRHELSWTPSTDLPTGLSRTWRWRNGHAENTRLRSIL
jgi:UDP-glucose 4-epimerase